MIIYHKWCVWVCVWCVWWWGVREKNEKKR